MDERQRVLELLDKTIDRSERYLKDAKDREDDNDIILYGGQLKVLVEMKETIEKW